MTGETNPQKGHVVWAEGGGDGNTGGKSGYRHPRKEGMLHINRQKFGRTIFGYGSPINATRPRSITPAWWSPGLVTKEHQEKSATGVANI